MLIALMILTFTSAFHGVIRLPKGVPAERAIWFTAIDAATTVALATLMFLAWLVERGVL